MSSLTAAKIIKLLGLEPHIEGGFYKQSFADGPGVGGRPHSTMIYYMLTEAQQNSWHRVDSSEGWHWYAGAPMLVRYSRDGKSVIEATLGPDLEAGERPQLVVPGNAWQRSRCLGEWSLVGCTVAPGFQYSKFEQAAPGWEPC